MKERLDVVKPARGGEKYDFARLRPGASWHVDTDKERTRVLAAFTYWAKNIRKIQAKATSLKVDASDPDGPGYRIWFLSLRQKDAPVPSSVTNSEDI